MISASAPNALTRWNIALFLTALIGIYLSMMFGLMGLLAFSLLNTFICIFCPNFVFLNMPKHPKGDTVIVFALGLTILCLPIVVLLVLFILGAERSAVIVSHLDQLGVIHNVTQQLAKCVLEPSCVSLSGSTEPAAGPLGKLALSLALVRVLVFVILPVTVSIGAADQMQWIRRRAEMKASATKTVYKKHSKNHSRLLAFFMFAFLFLCLVASDLAIVSPSFLFPKPREFLLLALIANVSFVWFYAMLHRQFSEFFFKIAQPLLRRL